MKGIGVILFFLFSASLAAASITILAVPCQVVQASYNAVKAIGYALVAIMFLYGGGKYVYSADDPAGRKQGKSMCIHAIIGAIIMGLVGAVINVSGCITI
jgi:hypothetical protein